MLEETAWEERCMGSTPKSMKGEIPVYEVIGEYVLKDDDEELIVSRAFSLKGDYLVISYNGKEYQEMLRIYDSKIIGAETMLVEKICKFPTENNLTDEELDERLSKFFSQEDAIQEVKTYHNIKRLEHRLKELPWQDLMKVVYDGNGII